MISKGTKMFKGGIVIGIINKKLWQDEACRLLLGVLIIGIAFMVYCFCCAKHLLIIVDQQEIPVIQFRGTVADALQKAHVTLRRADIVEVPLNSTVKDGASIHVTRVDTEEITNQELIQYKVVKKPDYNLPAGEQRVIKQGRCGLSREYIQITYQDGKEVKREQLRTEVVKKPEPQLVAYGPQVMVSRGTSRSVAGGAVRNLSNSMPLEDNKTITVVSTAYTHTGNRTATGIYPSEGIVAVDPTVIPLGTKLYVENYGYAVAADTGSDIKGNRIDVFFNSYDQAIHWGRCTIKVHLVE
ncbi:3D domain-containing protein [Desulfotomaculum sp. 1211_IL3151]|uniref:3D domain-containing protein n=1 Tax=Desulfotomaculum sp. 1211_IL3151 TaxID=3084055 RepID=UPI002FD8DE02